MPSDGDTKTAADLSNALAIFWAQCFEQSERQTRALLQAMEVAGDPRQMQQRWLDAVAQNLESFMRTPAFLQLMKQNLKAITDLKGLQDQTVKGAARQLGMPLADDITGLFERVNSVEQAIITRLKAIDSRLKAVETKLGGAPDQHEQS
jgi:predicted component of type VI protein secretion system